MPDIKLKNQPFDLDFHPSEPVVFAGLLTGEVKAFRYEDDTGEASSSWSVRPSKRTARAVCAQQDGQAVWVGGKAGGLYQLATADGSMKSDRVAHDVPVNRVSCVNENLVVSGDDDGLIKMWDPRQQETIRSYTQHYDYISDFVYFDDKRQLIATSGDGHLSVMDIRSNKAVPLSVSEDQEDELLSITPIKGDTKCVVGSTTGILSIWNRKSGWGDCVDRIPGHPASIDAIVPLTPDIIATGSEDGLIRVMQILPTKFMGVIASHEEYPIERLKLDRNKKWLGSVSHDQCLKLTDVEDLFEDSEGEEDVDMEKDADEDEEEEADSDSDGGQDRDTGLKVKGKKEPGFFDGL